MLDCHFAGALEARLGVARKRIGEILLERQLITTAELERGLARHRETGERLGSSLVALGILSEDKLCSALGEALGMEEVSMPPAEIDWAALHSLRGQFCYRHGLFPLRIESSVQSGRKSLVVAIADPLNLPALEEIEFSTGMRVSAKIAPLSRIRTAIYTWYRELREPSAPNPNAEMTIIRPGGVEEILSMTGEEAAAMEALPLTPEAEVADESEELAEVIRARIEERKKKRARSVDDDLDDLFGLKKETPLDRIEKLESRMWALLRILAKKGLITREEFFEELWDKD
jgi:hypothetical protein